MARRALTLTAFLLGFVACAQDLTVFAASSLTESFQSIAAAFEGRHEGVHVLLNFAGSSALALQIVQGAPADVFASANPQQMQKVVDEGLTAADPQIFAENRLVVIVPASSGLSDLLGLARPGIALVLAAPEVPVGAYARQALASMDGDFGADFSARVMANVVSEEPNTRQVAAKVELGEADAAVVYATDAAVTRGIRTIDIPSRDNVIATYPIAALRSSRTPGLAADFIAFVQSDEGQAMLARHGFRPPE